MADPKKVKPAKASGGAPSEDDLDRIELLNGMGVKIDAGEVQRLIEAARANANPPPAAAPAAPAVPQRIVVPRRQRQRAPAPRAPLDYTPLPPMPLTRRIKKPRQEAPVATGPTGEQQFVGWVIGAMVLAVAMPVIIMLFGAILQVITGRPTTAYGYTAIMGVVGMVFLFTGFYTTLARRSKQPSPPATHHQGRDDDEDDGYITQTYRDQRWQGDNGLNGRVGWENNGRAY